MAPITNARLGSVRAAQPGRVRPVHRIAADIGVHVHSVAIADRIGLEEAAEAGIVDPGAHERPVPIQSAPVKPWLKAARL